MPRARLSHVELPDFGTSKTAPEIPPSTYRSRLVRFRQAAAEVGYDAMVVYADREHSANLSYLTGFDPRFEEALLVIAGDGEPVILVGNECRGTAEAAPLSMKVRLFQDFSLPGQPRDGSLPLAELLGGAGIG